MKRYVVFFGCWMIFAVQGIYAQSTLKGVYAGLQTSVSVVPGGAMNRTDHVVYFRPDGTYCSELGKPGWKTAVSGHYTISGGKVTMTYNKGGKDFYTLKGGDMSAGSYWLLKMDGGPVVPAGYYEFTGGNSSGGMGTGLTYVGSMANVGLTFDGEGNFSRNASSAVVVSGSNVGGGGSKSSGGTGKYTLNDGVLTLKYTDGRVETHTFFCRSKDKPVMAAIDGGIYFMEDAPKSKSAGVRPGKTASGSAGSAGSSVGSGGTAAAAGAGGAGSAGSEGGAAGSGGAGSAGSDGGAAGSGGAGSVGGGARGTKAEAAAILAKGYQVQGGSKLDGIVTVRATAMVGDITLTSMVSLRAGRVRFETRRGRQLIGVEQLDGVSGWQFHDGQKTDLPSDRIRSIKSAFYSGVLGLRKQALDRIQTVKTQQSGKSVSVIFMADGNEYAFVFNEQGQLVGDGSKVNGTIETSIYGNFKEVDGLLLPFSELITTNGKKIAVRYLKYEINPTLSETEWNVPNQ